MDTKEFQRWTARRKVELLLQLIRGERKLVDVCREHDLKQSEVEGWMDTFVKAGERGLKARVSSAPDAGCGQKGTGCRRLLDLRTSRVYDRRQVLHGLPSIGTGWVELTVFEGCCVR